jgi:hypothetical protein
MSSAGRASSKVAKTAAAIGHWQTHFPAKALSGPNTLLASHTGALHCPCSWCPCMRAALRAAFFRIPHPSHPAHAPPAQGSAISLGQSPCPCFCPGISTPNLTSPLRGCPPRSLASPHSRCLPGRVPQQRREKDPALLALILRHVLQSLVAPPRKHFPPVHRPPDLLLAAARLFFLGCPRRGRSGKTPRLDHESTTCWHASHGVTVITVEPSSAGTASPVPSTALPFSFSSCWCNDHISASSIAGRSTPFHALPHRPSRAPLPPLAGT